MSPFLSLLPDPVTFTQHNDWWFLFRFISGWIWWFLHKFRNDLFSSGCNGNPFRRSLPTEPNGSAEFYVKKFEWFSSFNKQNALTACLIGKSGFLKDYNWIVFGTQFNGGADAPVIWLKGKERMLADKIICIWMLLVSFIIWLGLLLRFNVTVLAKIWNKWAFEVMIMTMWSGCSRVLFRNLHVVP